MLDFSNLKTLAFDGVDLKDLVINGARVWKSRYTNQVPISIDENGNIYNGCGYKDGYRIRSGGLESEDSTATCTGYIPFKKGEVLRISPAFIERNTQNALNFADATFTNLGQITDSGANYGICQNKQSVYDSKVIDGVSTLTYTEDFDERIAYVRVTHYKSSVGVFSGSEVIVTINEGIIKSGGFTNQIPISTDMDGSVYNGVGFADDTYLSEGVPTYRDGIACTGFIPIGCGSSRTAAGEWVVRMFGIRAKQETTFRFAIYNADKTFITQLYGINLPNSEWGDIQIPYEVDENGNVTMFDLSAITWYLDYATSKGKPAYMRICCPQINNGSILTVNEEIEE